MVSTGGTAVEGLAVGLDVDIKGANQQIEQELSKTTKMIGNVFSSSFGAGLASVAAGAVGTVAALGAAMALTVGAASKFEDSFAGIKKTVDASDAEFKSLALSVRQLATEIPIATSQLNQIGELGGQLGVSTTGLPIFIETIAKLGVATRLSTESAALSLARLQTIFQLPEQDVDNLASSLVDLGNNFAALEAEILSTSLRLAAGAKVAGATVADTLGIATALQAVGVQSQAGGTAMARVFQAITVALQGGQKEMQVFAQVTGLGVDGFRQLATENPAEALNVFLIGLKRAADEGRNLVDILDQLGLKQQRTIRALLAVSEAGDLLTQTLTTANIAYDLNIALQEEANKRFETAKSQAKLVKNAFTELRIEIGNVFLPAFKSLLEAIQGTTLAMGSNDKAVEGMTTSLKVFVGIVASASTAITFMVGNLGVFRTMAAGTGQSAVAMRVAMASLSLQTKGFATSAILAAKAITFLQMNMIPILGILTALGIAAIAYQGANRRATVSVEAYTQAEASRLTIQDKVNESQERLNKLTEEALSQNVNPDTVPAIQVERERNKILVDNLDKLDKISNKEFLNIGMGFKDFEGVDEADEAIQVFDEFINARQQLDEAFNQQDDAITFPNVDSLAQQFVDAFGITMEQAEAILQRGMVGIREFLTIESLANPEAFKLAEDILTGYIQNVGAASNQSRMGLSQMSEDNTNLVRGFAQDHLLLKDITGRIGGVGNQREKLLETQTNLLKQYNDEQERLGLEPMDEDIFLNFPEEQKRVFEFIFSNQAKVNTELEETVVNITDITNKFDEAKAKAADFRQVIEDIEAPEIIDIQSIIDGVRMVEDLETILGAGIIQALDAGFPALALDFAEGGLDSENLGQMIAIVNSGFDDTDGIITTINEGLMQSNDEIAQLVQGTSGSNQEIIKHIQETYDISLDIKDVEEDREAIIRVLATMENDAKGDKADYLALTKEVLNAERSIKDAKREIADLQEKQIELNANLVYDNIVITNAKRDEVAQSEALIALNEALAQFGREGVETNHEKLEILQAELNIQKMTDRIENKRSKRQQKSIRDKQKEVEFLKKAVEQGVVEQLDLDVAQEELDKLKNPMSKEEKDILTLQRDIAKAELEVTKARKEGLDPAVISAIENYNSSLKITADREKEIAEITEEITRKTEDLQFEQAEVAERYDEILEKYPDFKEKSMEIAQMIGIPQQVMQSALDGMGTTVDKFIEYVDFAKNYRDTNLGSEASADAFLNNITPPVSDIGYSGFGDSYDTSGYAEAIEAAKNYVPPTRTVTTPKQEEKGFFDKIFGNFLQGFSPSAFIPMYGGRAYGGTVPMGRASVVGEMGPEVIMSTPGGTSVFANKTGAGGSGVNIQNVNLNITGLPADPITARKVAQNIQRELNKLEKEGTAGTGLLNR